MSDEKGERDELAEDRTQFAEERTEWAEERTEWADQRTYAGWIRTGLTSMAVGFGIVEFMREVEPTWLIVSIGVLFIVIGAAVEAVAFISFRHVSLEMQEKRDLEMSLPVWSMAAIAGGLILCAVGGVAIVVV